MKIKNILAAGVIVAGTVVSAVAANASNLVQTAVDAGQFKTLVAAVQAAGLGDALSGPGPFTVLPRQTRLLPSCRKARSRIF